MMFNDTNTSLAPLQVANTQQAKPSHQLSSQKNDEDAITILPSNIPRSNSMSDIFANSTPPPSKSPTTMNQENAQRRKSSPNPNSTIEIAGFADENIDSAIEALAKDLDFYLNFSLKKSPQTIREYAILRFWESSKENRLEIFKSAIRHRKPLWGAVGDSIHEGNRASGKKNSAVSSAFTQAGESGTPQTTNASQTRNSAIAQLRAACLQRAGNVQNSSESAAEQDERNRTGQWARAAPVKAEFTGVPIERGQLFKKAYFDSGQSFIMPCFGFFFAETSI
jgi:hypothetical protein